jgi:hypothetical protein
MSGLNALPPVLAVFWVHPGGGTIVCGIGVGEGVGGAAGGDGDGEAAVAAGDALGAMV